MIRATIETRASLQRQVWEAEDALDDVMTRPAWQHRMRDERHARNVLHVARKALLHHIATETP